MPKKIKLATEQKEALKKLLHGENVFLTGKAGTGKSTVISAFRDIMDSNVAYVAPTGIAAVNIGGVTAHSLFQIKPGCFSDIEPLKSDKRRRLLAALNTVIVDEISMVRSDLLAAIDKRLREVAKGKNHGKPFGGKQIIVVGDFYQLPPVVVGDNELNYLNMRYGGPFAFQSQAWADANFTTIELQEVHRQTDAEFLNILNSVRVGESSAIDQLNSSCLSSDSNCRDGIVITPYRAKAASINAEELAKLNTRQFSYTGKITGKFTKDLPVDEHLSLRVGARVMACANVYDKNEQLLYCNGDLGEVASLTDDYVVVRFDNGTSHTIRPYEWHAYEYDLSGSSVTASEVGQYAQIPLKLAWAVTIHKSQGCTFDRCVIDIGSGCFAPGQLYTALSRVRAIDGLTLTRELRPKDVMVAPEVERFLS